MRTPLSTLWEKERLRRGGHRMHNVEERNCRMCRMNASEEQSCPSTIDSGMVQAGGYGDSYASLSAERSPHQGCFLMSAGKWETIREHLIRTLSSGSSGRQWQLAGWKSCTKQCCSLPGAKEISRKLPWCECLDTGCCCFL